MLSSGGYPDASHAGGTKLSRVGNHGLDDVLAEARQVEAEYAEFADRIRTEDPDTVRAGDRPGAGEER
ncbi:MAG: hypothetical protein ACRDQ0_02475 [Pseudonocardia sp.]